MAVVVLVMVVDLVTVNVVGGDDREEEGRRDSRTIRE